MTFIDHHLQVGDALLGVLDPKILENGIPTRPTPCFRATTRRPLPRSKTEQGRAESWKQVVANDLFAATTLVRDADAVEHLADNTLDDIAVKRSAWAQAQHHAEQSTLAKLADTYSAAFLAPKVPQRRRADTVVGLSVGLAARQLESVKPELAQASHDLCRAHSVFHWWLAFPQVAAKGGFSVMLGNPPWSASSCRRRNFSPPAARWLPPPRTRPSASSALSCCARACCCTSSTPMSRAAEGLQPPNRAEMRLYEEFIAARRAAEAASLYAHDSGRYPLTGVGDVNTYALFAESLFQLTAPQGRAGFIVPTGIATDDSTKNFGQVSQSGRLVSLYDFENREGIFPAIDSRIKFSLLTLGAAEASQFVCFATQVEQVSDARRRFTSRRTSSA